RGNTFPPHALQGGRSSTRTVTYSIPPEPPRISTRGKRVPSDSRGILRPSRVAISTRIYSGSWTFARCYHEGFEDGAGRHPVRRLFRPEHGEDGERSRPILEALRDRRRDRPHEGGARRGRSARREGERHPDRREPEGSDRPPSTAYSDRGGGDVRRIYSAG